MREGRDISAFGFMFKKISMHQIYLRQWFEVDEFLDGLLELMATNRSIDNQSVLFLMKMVYREKEEDHSKGRDTQGFNFYNARRSIRSLEKALGQ